MWAARQIVANIKAGQNDSGEGSKGAVNAVGAVDHIYF